MVPYYIAIYDSNHSFIDSCVPHKRRRYDINFYDTDHCSHLELRSMDKTYNLMKLIQMATQYQLISFGPATEIVSIYINAYKITFFEFNFAHHISAI